MSVLNEVARLFLQYVDLKARQYTTQALEETKRIVLSLLLFLGSGIFWGIGIVFLFTALFFRLAPGLAEYAFAAMRVGLIAAAVGAVLTAAAARGMRARAGVSQKSN